MKRNLGFLFLAIASAALAQTPTVVEKPAAKASPTSVKAPSSGQKAAPGAVKVVPVAVQKPTPSAGIKAQPVAAAPVVSHPVASVPAKPVISGAPKVAPVKPAPVQVKTSAASPKLAVAPVTAIGKPVAVVVQSAFGAKPAVALQNGKSSEDKKPAPKALNGLGRRDPFTSPVVSMGATGSGCSAGKRCLTIDQVALKGIVRSDTGMIAVVVNAMDKAYFLRENDHVFNGYVLKISGDSIVFKESFHDKLGKPMTRNITKTITRPVA